MRILLINTVAFSYVEVKPKYVEAILMFFFSIVCSLLQYGLWTLTKYRKFTGKRQRQSLLFNKFASLRVATLLKKKLLHMGLPVNFAKFIRTPYLHNTSGWLLPILYVTCLLYFPLSKIFATKKVVMKKLTSWKPA